MTNFPAALAPVDTDLARELVADPYNLDFLALDPDYTERQLEDALVARLTSLLTELGSGFAFLGGQYRLPVGDRDYFADLLFFHLGLRRVRRASTQGRSAGRAEPEHLGKLNFYVNVVDDLLRRREHGDGSTIGILLAANGDEVVVEYALRGTTSPLAVSTYTTHNALPDEVRPALPAPRDSPRSSATCTTAGHRETLSGQLSNAPYRARQALGSPPGHLDSQGDRETIR